MVGSSLRHNGHLSLELFFIAIASELRNETSRVPTRPSHGRGELPVFRIPARRLPVNDARDAPVVNHDVARGKVAVGKDDSVLELVPPFFFPPRPK